MAVCPLNSGFPPVGAHGDSFGIFEPSRSPLGVTRGWKMIMSHWAPSSFNMSSYRAIWTHFKSNSIISTQVKIPKFWKTDTYSSGKHFSESCAPRKKMQNRVDEIFWGLTFKNTFYFNLRAAYFWKPLTSDARAQGCFFLQKNSPWILDPSSPQKARLLEAGHTDVSEGPKNPGGQTGQLVPQAGAPVI